MSLIAHNETGSIKLNLPINKNSDEVNYILTLLYRGANIKLAPFYELEE